jgi:Fe-S-cluster containining protein
LEETIYCKKMDVLVLRKEIKKIGIKNLKRRKFLTTKKEKDICVFFKGKCLLRKNAPYLCRMYPVFFKIDKKEQIITWLKQKKISLKKLNEKKKIAFDFLKEASRKELKEYSKIVDSLKLKEVEEEQIPQKLFSLIKRKL